MFQAENPSYPKFPLIDPGISMHPMDNRKLPYGDIPKQWRATEYTCIDGWRVIKDLREECWSAWNAFTGARMTGTFPTARETMDALEKAKKP